MGRDHGGCGSSFVPFVVIDVQSLNPMPELPEVETIARGLAKRVTGDVIESVWLGQKKEPLKSPASQIAATLEHNRIMAVHRVGKHIVFDLDRVARAPSPAKSRKAVRNRKGTNSTQSESIAQPGERARPTNNGRAQW